MQDTELALLGPSGGGKSTLLKAVAGLLPPRSGTLEVAGAVWPMRPLRGQVGYVPQRLGLVRHASVLANVLQGGLHETTLAQSLLRRAPPAVLGHALAALGELGLADKARQPAHELSGGQQRRVAVARAPRPAPPPPAGRRVPRRARPGHRRHRRGGGQAPAARDRHGLLVVEHQLDQALRLADRVYRLKGGRLQALEAP
ncbi:MAG TPA: ATP-binding cassette domain-containing protein [Candidatus Thermoplasmatota archaeon]|nr:ATP-binding cassette domain-containing protein [Candidatus Thermoplasmatota archaeon]